MAKLTEIEQLRRRRARKKTWRNLLLLTVFGAIVMAVASVAGSMGKTELKAAVSDIKAEITSGSGFPVPLPGGRLQKMTAAGSTLLLQTDTNLYTYNETGRQMLNYQHGLGNAVTTSARDRILAYDRGGMRIHMLSRSAVLQSMDTKFAIYDADLNDKGTFAVASGSDSFLAQVAVYDSNLKNIFNWFSADYPVISVSVADGRDAMVVGCIGVKGGGYHSEIKRFQFSVSEEMARAELKPDELLLSLDYHGAAGIRAITDSRVVLFNAELKELEEYSFASKRLVQFNFLPDGRVMLLLQGLTGEKSNSLVLLDDKLGQTTSLTVDNALISMSADAEHIYLTSSDAVSIRNIDGSEAAVVMAGGLHGAQAIGSKLYYATPSELVVTDIKEAMTDGGKGSSSNKGSSSSKNSSKTSDASKSEPQEGSSVPEDESGPEDENMPEDASVSEGGSSTEGEGVSSDDILSKPI